MQTTNDLHKPDLKRNAWVETPGKATQNTMSPVRQNSLDDLAYLNADSAASLASWSPRPAEDIRRMQALLLQEAKSGDNFVTIPLPQIAGQGASAIKAVMEAHQKEAAIVDTRLARQVGLQAKGISFTDLCERLRTETGVQIMANRRVADDKITVFCHPRALRDLMRQISRHFGFTWLRKGEEGAYEYELTQSMRSQLLEEGMRERDQEEMLLAIDRNMERFRKYRGMSLAQLNAIDPKSLKFQDHSDVFQLQLGGLVPMNAFFALSQSELDNLRSGQPLILDLLGRDAQLLPPNVTEGIRHSFDDDYDRQRNYAKEHGYEAHIPDTPTALIATLKLDRSKPGEMVLKGNLSDGHTGLEPSLAVAKSPAYTVKNAQTNAKLAGDPKLQPKITLEPKATCTLASNPFPDTEGFFQSTGDKVTSADVLQTLYEATGMDIVSDYFSHLHRPADVTVKDMRLFDALNRIGDQMRMRWTKQDGWLQFRTGTFYYDRPQEVPNRFLEHWMTIRKKKGALSPEDLTEIAQLSDAQLDSLWMAQGATAIYHLDEWQMARIPQLRPHWRFLARLTADQRRAAWSEKGLVFSALSPELQNQFLELTYDGNINRPGRIQIKEGSLRVLYGLGDHSVGEGMSYAVLPSNPILFLYNCNDPNTRDYHAVIGPFNAIYGILEHHLTPQAFQLQPPPRLP